MFSAQFATPKGANLHITGEQGSDFAKTVSNDFNPIHDPENRRFCVPGDLLFALAVENYGLSEKIHVDFTGLVSADTQLIYPLTSNSPKTVTDDRGKQYLTFHESGNKRSFDKDVEKLVRQYVAFSGQNFPSILVPLMAESGVMINPSRPLIIYQSMTLQLTTLEFSTPSLFLSKRDLSVSEKRGNAYLYFDIFDGAKLIGEGMKYLILSGLKPFDQKKVDEMVGKYNDLKDMHAEP
jgi:hypothetical protein